MSLKVDHSSYFPVKGAKSSFGSEIFGNGGYAADIADILEEFGENDRMERGLPCGVVI
jgi:hypothetical protein